MRQHIGTSLAVIALAAAFAAAAQDQAAAAKLARETVALISLQDHMMVTAVRQKGDRKGAADYQRFILDPITRLGDQWTAQPSAVRLHYLSCATALQEHENHVRDSFKAGKIGQPSSLRVESATACSSAAGPAGRASKK